MKKDNESKREESMEKQKNKSCKASPGDQLYHPKYGLCLILDYRECRNYNYEDPRLETGEVVYFKDLTGCVLACLASDFSVRKPSTSKRKSDVQTVWVSAMMGTHPRNYANN